MNSKYVWVAVNSVCGNPYIDVSVRFLKTAFTATQTYFKARATRHTIKNKYVWVAVNSVYGNPDILSKVSTFGMP